MTDDDRIAAMELRISSGGVGLTEINNTFVACGRAPLQLKLCCDVEVGDVVVIRKKTGLEYVLVTKIEGERGNQLYFSSPFGQVRIDTNERVLISNKMGSTW